jgi:hypothetical protein
MKERSVIDEKYVANCSTWSDIYEHLPVLARYGGKCKHITEMGVRSVVSSYAFAHALKDTQDNKLVQVDLETNSNVDIFNVECTKEGVNVVFYKDSSLTCPIENTDLLFIDTWHVYGHLKRELERWNTYVAKYIIMHDTTVDEWIGESIRCSFDIQLQSEKTGIPSEEIARGLWPAIDEFLNSHPEWKLRERYFNNNGLTVLERISNDNLHAEPIVEKKAFPIGFAIPKCKIRIDVADKLKTYGHVIPGNLSTYIFDNEQSYYDDYATSVFGHTKQKGGWDCLRHYEILANGCIPYFENIENCPTSIMTFLPKDTIKAAMKDIQPLDESTLTDKHDLIMKYSSELLEYTRNNLTTEKMASYILNITGNSDAKTVLYLSQDLYPDYLRCLMLHGFKDIFKTNCHDVPRINHLYTDCTYTSTLYGRGFSYTALLDPVEFRDPRNDTNIDEDIRNKKYDVVVYGSIHKEMPYCDLVTQTYSKDKIIMLCGEDSHECVIGKTFIRQGYNVFIRELE